ncbi:MAG: hemolysin family protein [Anaerovoracaceae bacterium]|nr:hemolysin family protein [Anaerovoracaceae bacterium]
MSSDIIGYIVAIFILVLLSAYFSATETAFTSVNKIRLKNMAYSGDKKAETVLKLSEKYDKLLTTILVGNNIVNITMTSVATVLFIDLFGPYGATLATVVITIIVLVFGEITPKNIAKEVPENFSKFSAPALKFFMTLLTPVNFIFTMWKKFIAKVFKLNDNEAITGDEILTMVEEAEEGGGIEKRHSELIQNAIEFYELTAEDVMTPRPEMEAIETDCPKEELAEIFKKTGFSRLPVYEEDIDKIIGVINQKDFHNYIVGTGKNIVDYVSPVVFVSTAIKISDLLKKMQQVKTHMAIVIDEYGGTEGLVTMEDIIEELVGEIFDEHDVVISKDIMPLQNGSFRVKGSANISKVFDYFDIDEELDVVTVNGWVVLEMDKMPKKNDMFETVIDGKLLKVRVTKADDRKAIEINLTVKDKNDKGNNNKENNRKGKDTWA